MTKEQFLLISSCFLLLIFACKTKEQEEAVSQESTGARAVPIPQASSPEPHPVYGPTGEKIGTMAVEEVPEEEVLAIEKSTSTPGWKRVINKHGPDFSIEVPENWQTDSPAGYCSGGSCETTYMTVFRDGEPGKAKFEVTVTHYSWYYYDPDPDYLYKRSLARQERISTQPPFQWHREKVNLGGIHGEFVVFKPDNLEEAAKSFLPESTNYFFLGADLIPLNPKEQTLIFRVTPKIKTYNLIVYVALHGNNPSKEDWELARRVALSFRYLGN